MRVSVITATYNVGEPLARTIESVAEQSHGDIEHVVVDGGSTDSTLAVVQRHEHRLASWISEPDDGIYDALNKGIERSSGGVIAFLHAGDVYESRSAISRMITSLEESGSEISFSDVAFFREGSQQSIVRRYSSAQFTPDRIRYGFMPAHPTMFVRRSTYERVGKFETTYSIAGDFEWVVRAFLVHQVSWDYVSGVLVRMVAGGLSTRGWSSKRLITAEMLRACRTHGIPTSRFRLWLRFPIKSVELLSR